MITFYDSLLINSRVEKYLLGYVLMTLLSIVKKQIERLNIMRGSFKSEE